MDGRLTSLLLPGIKPYPMGAGAPFISCPFLFSNRCMNHPLTQAISSSRLSVQSLGAIAMLSLGLTSCSFKSNDIGLTSGVEGGGYAQLAEVIQTSSESVGKLKLENQLSQGSTENLARLKEGSADVAISQLDVASAAMKAGEVQSIVTLADEYLYVIVPQDSTIQQLTDLTDRRVGLGTAGSGIHFTANRLLNEANIAVEPFELSLVDSFEQIRQGNLDAAFYVGPHRSALLAQAFQSESPLRVVPISPALLNFYTLRSPEAYQAAIIPAGIHQANPPIPPKDISTLSTSTALVTRPEVSSQKVALLTWSILSSAQRYAPFYPELAQGNPRQLLSQGLMYLHPGAAAAFNNGDPRSAWLRYIQGNKPLQTAFIMLTTTTSIGYILQRMRRRKSKAVIKGVRQVVMQLRSQISDDPARVAREITSLRQQQRLRMIDDEISLEVYEQLERVINPLGDQCLTMLETQRQEAIATILNQLDNCQVLLRQAPDQADAQIAQLEDHARQLLEQDRIDLPTFLKIKELTWNNGELSMAASSILPLNSYGMAR